MWKQLTISVLSTLLMSCIGYLAADFIGYRSVALLLLFMVSVLSVILSVYPVLTAAVLSALIWDYFFIPPYFTFHVNSTEDILMLSMYFVIALLSGITTLQIRNSESQSRLREEKLNALKLYNTLFNSIAHELRTPITTIMGVSETLARDSDRMSESVKKEMSSEIFIASERLNRLIENLLNKSRLEAGFLKLKKDWCDCEELIYTSINRLKPEIDKYPVKVNIKGKLPYFRLDIGLMEQALCNVLHNVCTHTPSGTEIEIIADYVGEQLILEILDNGPGFKAGDSSQGSNLSSDRSRGGLGLGLSIANGFVSAHHGEMITCNKTNGGACVRMIIPAEVTQIEPEYE